MKKLLLLAILAIFTANLAQSQTLTETIKYDHGLSLKNYVPDKFAFNNKGSFYITDKDEYYNSDILKVTFYDCDIQEKTSFNWELNLCQYNIIRERQQDADGKYTGEWVEKRINYYDYEYSTEYYDVSTMCRYDTELPFTQTLFNNDEKYEYITPVFGEFEKDDREEDRDYDGEIDYISTSYYGKVIGFDVKNQDGKVVSSIRPSITEGYKLSQDRSIFEIGGKRYLVTEAWEYDGSGYEITFYLIDPNSTSLQQVGQPLTASVFPTMPRNNDVINVELEGNDKPGEIVVTNTKGQTVYKQKVAAGERRVQINSRRLSNGLNIITVNNGDEKQNFKVIVK